MLCDPAHPGMASVRLSAARSTQESLMILPRDISPTLAKPIEENLYTDHPHWLLFIPVYSLIFICSHRFHVSIRELTAVRSESTPWNLTTARMSQRWCVGGSRSSLSSFRWLTDQTMSGFVRPEEPFSMSLSSWSHCFYMVWELIPTQTHLRQATVE